MLLVKTMLRESPIAGIGIFATENIEKGAKVWTFEPSLDVLLSKEEIEKLSVPAREQVLKYAYLDKVRGKYLLCGDDGRYFNHSDNPNCDESIENDSTYAKGDISIGEELTINYKEFYGNMNEHPEIQ
jgi:hypothetical protein